MKPQAIALRRISSLKQAEGHSLDAQESSTEKMSKEMDLEIVKAWRIIQTSNRGKNFGRKDMEEMLAFCKKNRRVKYLLIDFVNRLMREAEVLIYYKVLFNQLGVQLVFCDPAQHNLNSGDQYSKLMLYIEAFSAEQDNDHRTGTTVSKMKARIEQGYYLTRPHQGYVKSDIPGIHAPDPVRFKTLQNACKHIIYDGWSVSQAVKWLNDSGYRTRAGNKMDLNHFIELFEDPYYCGIITIRSDGWPKNVPGLHQPMLSQREHKILVSIMSKRNPRLRMKHNPEFPMANILRHQECMGIGKYEKFAGVNHNRGKRNGKQRPIQKVYDCRDCRKRLSRDKVHTNFTHHLGSLQLLPDEQRFLQALVKVWKMQRGSVTERLRTLEVRKQSLEQKMQETTATYALESDILIKTNLKKLITGYGEELESLEKDIIITRDVELESEDFVRFAVEYMSNLAKNWWDLSYENRKRGEQILFNGKIYANNSAIIHTPELSTIYRLGTNKKDLEKVSLSNMVELAGTAPASASLSWLVFYRFRLFKNLGEQPINSQKAIPQSPENLSKFYGQ